MQEKSGELVREIGPREKLRWGRGKERRKENGLMPWVGREMAPERRDISKEMGRRLGERKFKMS